MVFYFPFIHLFQSSSFSLMSIIWCGEDMNPLNQIKEFERIKAARDAICLLGKLTGVQNMEILQRQYTLLRDFLIVEISIDNANRSGALANMKMGEFKKK